MGDGIRDLGMDDGIKVSETTVDAIVDGENSSAWLSRHATARKAPQPTIRRVAVVQSSHLFLAFPVPLVGDSSLKSAVKVFEAVLASNVVPVMLAGLERLSSALTNEAIF